TSADLDLTHPPAYRLFRGISPREVPPSAGRDDREAAHRAVGAAPVDSGHRPEVGHLAEHGPEIPADAGATDGHAAAPAPVEGGCLPGSRAPTPGGRRGQLRGLAARAARPGLRRPRLDSEGPRATPPAGPRRESDHAL